MKKLKKLVAAAAAVASVCAIGVTAFAAQRYYNYNFSIYGNTDTGYYQFTSACNKESSWLTPAEVLVYSGNINSRNSVAISVYNEDCLDYPGGSITDYVVADHLTTTEAYYLEYDLRFIDDTEDKMVHLCAETGDEYVNFKGEWTP